MLLATNGATDYWYRATRGWSHPSIRNASVMIGNLLANGANYTISVAAAVGDQERVEQLLKKDDGLARRLDSARVSPLSYAAREGHLHIVRLLLEDAPIRTFRRSGCDGLALFAVQQSHGCRSVALEHGANPNAGWIRAGAVSRFARCATGTGQNRTTTLATVRA